ncbi:hypothetical protein HGO36_01605 [Agrobacterium vitis]|nr:hypothetical protein [Agrobacterium vitis]
MEMDDPFENLRARGAYLQREFLDTGTKPGKGKGERIMECAHSAFTVLTSWNRQALPGR